MTLQEEFERSGTWLFRRRSYLPLLLLPFCGASLLKWRGVGEIPYNQSWELLCLAVCGLGLVIRAKTIGHVPARTSGKNIRAQIADQLNTSGLYSQVRHPLYLGNFFMYLGLVLFTREAWAILAFTGVFTLYYERIMFAEEAFLSSKFGQQYIDWARQTPAFFPRWSGYRPPGLPFAWRHVLRREFGGLFAVLLIMGILDFAADWLARGKPRLEMSWLVVLGLFFVLWLGLRLLDRYTQLLRVPGR